MRSKRVLSQFARILVLVLTSVKLGSCSMWPRPVPKSISQSCC